MIKRYFGIFLLEFILIVSILNPIVNAGEYENQYGKIVVFPDTDTGLIKHVQYIDLTTYITNDFDICFKFNEPLIKAEAYEYKTLSQECHEPIYENISGQMVLVGWNNFTEYYEKWVPVTKNFNVVFHENSIFYIVKNIHFDKNIERNFKFIYDTPIGSNGKWDLYMKRTQDTIWYALENNLYVHLDPWWNSSYINYRKITIDGSFIKENMNDFPLMVVLDNSSGDYTFHNGGRDIAFVSTDNTTQFNHLIEKFDNDDLTYCWVNITETMQTGMDYSFLVYYNNSGATSYPDGTGVFDNGQFDHVFLLNESNLLVAGDLNDLTSNMVLSTNGNPTYQQFNKVGYYIDGDGSGDYFGDTTPSSSTSDTFSMSIWCYLDDENDRGSVSWDNVACYNDGNSKGVLLVGRDFETDTCYLFNIRDSSNNYVTVNYPNFPLDTWFHIYVTFNTVLGNIGKAYVNGRLYGSDTNVLIGTADIDNNYYLFDNRFSTKREWNGFITHHTWEKSVRTLEYINFTYNNQNWTNGFATFSKEFFNVTAEQNQTDCNASGNFLWIAGLDFEPITVIIIMFMLFWWTAHEREDPILMMLTSVLLVAISLYYIAQWEILDTLFGVAIICVAIYGFWETFLFSIDMKTKKK